MFTGPQPQSRHARMERVNALVEQLKADYGDRLLAVGLYGSTANDTDGPFSDIELFCVVQEKELDRKQVWINEEGKIELDLYDPEAVVRKAT
ncbi:MAG: nucleotidyltransferase domain-containing protein, partial [Caldilineaceae bacterium]|nr:nucleotidyltransferase domain-containing protein [Caldilineaceae bacterium]